MSSATTISARQHTVESEMEMPSTRVRQKMKRHTMMKVATFHSGPHEPCAPVHHTSLMGETPLLPVASSLRPLASMLDGSPLPRPVERKLAWCRARMEARGKTATGMATIWAGT